MPWYIHINYYIFFETKQSIFMLSFKHPDYISGIAEFWYFLQWWTGTGQPSLGQEQAQGRKHSLSVFAANIRTSEHNVGLAKKLKHNIAHKYLSLSENIVLKCRLYHTHNSTRRWATCQLLPDNQQHPWIIVLERLIFSNSMSVHIGKTVLISVLFS